MSGECRVSLDALLADPATVSGLSPGKAAELLVKLTGVQALLVARLATRPSADGGQSPEAPSKGLASAPASADELLTVDEAALVLRISRRWLYRNARNLPFTRKLSRRALRFSRAGIARWLATKRL